MMRCTEDTHVWTVGTVVAPGDKLPCDCGKILVFNESDPPAEHPETEG